MFTGIVIETGRVKKAADKRGILNIEIEAALSRELDTGDSVSVNGVCLTATETSRKRFSAEVMSETLARSTLGALKRGSTVNLELPARLADRHPRGLAAGERDGDDRGMGDQLVDPGARHQQHGERARGKPGLAPQPLAQTQGPMTGLAASDPLRIEFDRLHGLSNMLFSMTAIGGLALCFWETRE